MARRRARVLVWAVNTQELWRTRVRATARTWPAGPGPTGLRGSGWADRLRVGRPAQPAGSRRNSAGARVAANCWLMWS